MKMILRTACGKNLAGLIMALTVSGGSMSTALPQNKGTIDRRVISPNRVAPELYSDKIGLKITLINLPGAKNAQSNWQAEYKVFFVPEKDFEETTKRLSREGKLSDLKPDYFPTRILLAEGSLSKKRLMTLPERTFVRSAIDFKSKIPGTQQTSFSSILSFYSIKIYDGELKKNIYQSDVFIVPPFDTDIADKSVVQPRSNIYLSFFVATDGALYKSNKKVSSETSEWRPN